MDVTPPSLRFVRPGPPPADEELLLEHDCYRRATEGASLCLTNEDAMAIAAQLRSTPCTGVLQIDLSRNRITQTGAAALALAIGESHAQSLEELDLSHNRIGPLGMATLGAVLATGALPTGSPPARLQLRGMVCTGGTLGALKDIHPKAGYCTVELFGGATTYAKTSSLLGAQVPEQWSTSLRVLNLSACHIGVQGARAAAAALRSMPALASLDLSANAICNSEGGAFGPVEEPDPQPPRNRHRERHLQSHAPADIAERAGELRVLRDHRGPGIRVQGVAVGGAHIGVLSALAQKRGKGD